MSDFEMVECTVCHGKPMSVSGGCVCCNHSGEMPQRKRLTTLHREAPLTNIQWYCKLCNRPLQTDEKCLCGIIPKKAGWEAETGGQKFDADKPRLDLLDGYAIEELAKVLTFGAKKYAPHNWRKGITFSRLLAASARHLFAIMRGENKDEETGLDHAAHLMCCAMFLVWTAKHKPDMDDRYREDSNAQETKRRIAGVDYE